ncbi:hypothetical protein JCGZ_13604 [Jatropha curcas]|uniref:Uncharacterized protein n=1 Tax=Jatropha curcas TaxID=180498 RepID=A0A067KAA0_JATCU|nr:hypothetical protein JCGZ_13604 [Jatropha curcas]
MEQEERKGNKGDEEDEEDDDKEDVEDEDEENEESKLKWKFRILPNCLFNCMDHAIAAVVLVRKPPQSLARMVRLSRSDGGERALDWSMVVVQI